MRKCAAFLALSMACCIAGSCVIRINSFQTSRDPIVPETGLGQRAGRLPCARHCERAAAQAPQMLGCSHRAAGYGATL